MCMCTGLDKLSTYLFLQRSLSVFKYLILLIEIEQYHMSKLIREYKSINSESYRSLLCNKFCFNARVHMIRVHIQNAQQESYS